MKNLINFDSKILEKVWNSIDRTLINPIATITNAKAESIANTIKIKNEINTLDEDWFMHFSEKAKLCSKKDIQLIWAKVLAEKLTRKTNISKRLLHTISILSPKDCKNFEIISKFVLLKNNIPTIIISDIINLEKEYDAQGVNYDLLSYLAASGLIISNPYLGLTYRIEKPVKLMNKESQALFTLTSSLKVNEIQLTPFGEELFNVLNFEASIPLEFIIKEIKNYNPHLEIIWSSEK